MDTTRVRTVTAPAAVVSAGLRPETIGARQAWRQGLPVLQGAGVTLRNLCVEDAASLMAHLATTEVAEYISPAPRDLQGFERFVQWALDQQAAGALFCFAVVPDGMDEAVGVIQVCRLGESFEVAEWGFAVGASFWGTGIFATAANLVIDYVFDAVGVERLEARCAVENKRGSGALRKLGAVAERLIPSGLVLGTKPLDQMLWSILRNDRMLQTKFVWTSGITVH